MNLVLDIPVMTGRLKPVRVQNRMCFGKSIRFSPSTILTKPACAGFRNKGGEKPGFGMTRRLKPIQGVQNRMCSHLAIFTPVYKNPSTPPRTKKIPDLV
jgi:hypothetical protein